MRRARSLWVNLPSGPSFVQLRMLQRHVHVHVHVHGLPLLPCVPAGKVAFTQFPER